MKRIFFQILCLISFVASYSQDSIPSPDEGVWFAEENATFQGGDVSTFASWIIRNINYPNETF